jgi:SAM-dependent methyltransferase
MKEQWFESWFDSPWYPLLYDHRSEEEAADFINSLIPLLELRPGSECLDAGCGSGRHAGILANHSLRVTGIDLSPESIRRATEKYGHKADFQVWDMRKLFRPNHFDAIFNLFSSFGYFRSEEENQNMLFTLSQSLKPGGVFVMDYLNAGFVVAGLKSRELINKNGIQFQIRRRLEDGAVIKTISFLADGADHEYEEYVKLYHRAKVTEMLAECGLRVSHCFGDYRLSEFHPIKSPRLLLICRKTT